eukprot:336079-Ditylum_brightwellii.AAC.1
MKERIFKDMMLCLQKRERDGEKFGWFMKHSPCCTILDLQTDVKEDLQFDYDNSQKYNVKVIEKVVDGQESEQSM